MTYKPPLIQSGRPDAPLWIVGEAPGKDEVATGRPFIGASGQLLDILLRETGFDRSSAFITNVAHERPPDDKMGSWFLTKKHAKESDAPVRIGRAVDPRLAGGVDHLHNLLAHHSPKFILAFGGTALWSLTGEWGITKWRASHLVASATPNSFTPVLPTIHPAAILREWPWRNIVLQDLRRARRLYNNPDMRPPNWRFVVRPSLERVIEVLHNLKILLDNAAIAQPWACDIETRAGQIACVGLAWTQMDAICIPFLCIERPEGYWNESEEKVVTTLLRDVLIHPRAHLIFQNGAYDLQYFAKQWGYLPRIGDDTMLMQHVAFPGLRKGLDFLSSLYCVHHRYWKDDGKNWDDAANRNEDQYWRYNCEDCVRTLECWEQLQVILQSQDAAPAYRWQMDKLFPIVLRMMLRGVRTDKTSREAMTAELEGYLAKANAWLEYILDRPLNVASTTQVPALFYGEMGIPPVISRKTGRPTLDDKAFEIIKVKNPVLAPLITCIQNTRSARKALETVLADKAYSPDGRIRCTYNLAGTETFRFSSSEDAFGFGFNLQNLTKGDKT